MVRFRIVAVATVMALSIGAAVAWEAGIQPQIASHEAFAQMDIRTDGSGDRAAMERRVWTNAQHLPAEIAMLVGALSLAVLLTWFERKTPSGSLPPTVIATTDPAVGSACRAEPGSRSASGTY